MRKYQAVDQYPITPEAVQNALNEWGITPSRFTPIERGVENRSFFLSDKSRSYVLRVYRYGSVTEEDVISETLFMTELCNQGLPVPPLQKTIHQNLFAQFPYQGKEWYAIVMERMPGAHISHYTEENVKEIGAVMAEMHRISIAYCDGKANHPPLLIRDRLIDTVVIEAENDENVRSFLSRIKNFALVPHGLRCAIAHRDFTRGNLLFHENTLTAILDFEAIKYTPLIEDVAVMVWNLLFNIQLKGASPQLVQSFITAYQSKRVITATEKAMFTQFLLYRTYILGTIDYVLDGPTGVADDIRMEKIINELEITALFF